jgi:hypothetical protein
VAIRQLTWDEKQRLCEALLKIRALHDVDLRNLYVTELESHLGHTLSVQRFPGDTRHDLWSLITACQPYPTALRSFVQIIRGVQGTNQAVQDAERLLDELEGIPLMVPADRDELVSMLSGIAPEWIAAAFHDVAEPEALRPQPNWQDVKAVVRRMEVLTPVGDNPPPVLVFVDRVAHRVERSRSIDLHRWIDRVGGVAGMDQASIRHLCVETRRRLDDGRLPADGGSSSDNLTGKSVTPNLPDTIPSAGVPVISVSPSTSSPTLLPVDHPEPQRIWGGVPIRNPDFTGRESLLSALARSLEEASKASVLPQTLHGLGGVGKTQLALEYVYRSADQYDLVWWISAEQPPLVLASLEELGRRLGLPISEDKKQTAATVKDALASSPLRWLLVFDNADRPDDISDLVPSAGGHVLLTSRNHAWANVWDAIEVDVFDRDESVELLRKRSSAISSTDAHRLADKLGDLPLALDQAASWQAATGMPVSEYLQLFDEHVRELLSEGKPMAYPTTVAAFVSLAFERLRQEAPAVAQLLEMFAFLGAEPISVSLLRRGREAKISQPLSRALRDSIGLSRTIRDLRRYGLAKVDPDQRIQVHRLIQLVLRESLGDELSGQARSNVHNLLASANPGEPDQPDTWQAHAEIGPHILAGELIDSDNVEARRVALDQIRFLYVIGDYEGSRRLGEIAAASWERGEGEGVGPDGELTLIGRRHLAGALRALGMYERARTLQADTYERMCRVFGKDHEHTLSTARALGADLRIAGDFPSALRTEEESVGRHLRVFGEEDASTLWVRNNLAVSLRMLSDFARAYEIDQAVAGIWVRTVGEGDHRTLFSLSNVARDLYGLGRYSDALELQQRIWPAYRDQIGAGHSDVLLAARTIAIALRKTGKYEEASVQARENYRNYHSRFGPDHEHTLAATMSYANTLRAVGELSEARSLASEAVALYRRRFGQRHPLTLAAQVNLAIVLRALGELREARTLDQTTFEAMRAVLGPEHGYTLCAANNLANDMVLAHDLAAARELSEQTLATSRRARGENHPYTLACAINTAFDRQAAGDDASGQELLDQTLVALGRVLGPEHPETLDAGRGKRAECDIEPPPT